MGQRLTALAKVVLEAMRYLRHKMVSVQAHELYSSLTVGCENLLTF